ncbi:MAG: AlpA family transcriptional regulator [Pseudomonadota bacterium]|nr:AlpA family transcriptional regulator [Pseudomonadota bacterium]
MQEHTKFASIKNIPIGNRLLKRIEVEFKTGLSRSSIYSAIRARTFPEPVAIGVNRVAWLEAEIDKWIEEKLTARNTATAR